MRAIGAHVALLILSLAAVSGAEELWRDNFRQWQQYELRGARIWQIGDGACRFRGGSGEGLLLTRLPDLTEMSCRATLTVTEHLAGSWPNAGLALVLDPSNTWQLLLVQSPEKRRYCELVERFRGRHQAQSTASTPQTLLAVKQTGDLQEWEYGKRYELVLRLTPEGISGTVTDPASGESWQRSYSFSRGLAVRRGRPALRVVGMAGRFEDFVVEGSRAKQGKEVTLRDGRAGRIAILADEQGRVAERLRVLLEAQGYGVTVMDWDTAADRALPWQRLDLLVLADARRMPTVGRDLLVECLRMGGKALAIGAPALGQLLVRAPGGWVTESDYAEAIVETLKPVPIALPQDAWRRAARNPEKQSAIRPAPEQGANAWRVDLDLEGWDGFGQQAEGAFGRDRTITTFWAKGDGKTSQLALEWTEKDHARWIATIPLSEEWRPVVLRPRDFAYWHDSDADRGASGDQLQPQNVARFTLGLSSSHTPKVEAGRHTFWFRDFATAKDPAPQPPDFYVPDIEGVCPSYKLYPLQDSATLRAGPEQGLLPSAWQAKWRGAAYSPVWRERGRGFGRGRPWRWVPVVQAQDRQGKTRGALVWLMVGDTVSPGAVWANVGVADPQQALGAELQEPLRNLVAGMTQGLFLLEGGAEWFSYRDGEPVALGASVVNASRQATRVRVGVQVVDRGGKKVFDGERELRVAAGQRAEARWTWSPKRLDREGYEVETVLRQGTKVLDRIAHRVERLPSEPAKADEFVRVEGSNFMLGDQKWYMLGINYRPNFVGGYPGLDVWQRQTYDPEVFERDLSWMESIGINFISAVHALQPPNPDDPASYRDLHDFLDRCRRHHIKVFFFLPWGRPYRGADVQAIEKYIEVAGIKNHPAIHTWELAWEPIETPWSGRMNFFRADWNRWVLEQYGTLENAETDWGYQLPRTGDGKLEIPSSDLCVKHGEWDRVVAAFRRAFSDMLSRKYGEIIRELHAWDPRHLVTFRGGACGIPDGVRFAHLHSVGVAKHVDYLCPEGYNLRTKPWCQPTPADDLRKGGLVTLYYRFISREKPVVWMEFGYTVNGFRGVWRTGQEHVDPQELQRQRTEYEHFYAMFLESGARGAAPWWLPGGFRLGENSDFGVLEPDGTERPACEVLRRSLPRFAQVKHPKPDTFIELDFDRHYADAWKTYGEQYLRAVKQGKRPYCRTAGTGTDSATAPLTAVGGGAYHGHNPLEFLNGEFNRLEIRTAKGQWRAVRDGDTVQVTAGQPVRCRASVGNIAEATWLAPRRDLKQGGVYLAGRKEYGREFRAPIERDTPFLADATVPAFDLPASPQGEVTVSFQMWAEGRAYFGERRTVTLEAVP